MTKAERDERVSEVIGKLRLEKCQDSVIGNILQRGISGGQAKRCNIALALVEKKHPHLVVVFDRSRPVSGVLYANKAARDLP